MLVVGAYDRAGRVEAEVLSDDRVVVFVGALQARQGLPAAEVVPVVRGFDHRDVGGVFHDGVVDRDAFDRRELCGKRFCLRIGSPKQQQFFRGAPTSRLARLANASKIVFAFQINIPEFQ